MFALLIQSVYSQSDKDTANLLKVGDDMPEFSLTTLDGRTISSDDLYGKVVLINFFASWSPPSMLQLPVIESEIYDKYKDDENFEVVVINREEGPEEVKKFMEKRNLTMPVYLDGKNEVYSQFAIRFLPRNYLFDRESRLILQSMGYKKKEFEVLQKEIEVLLKKKN
jgi:peroxiredoxin